MNRKCRTDLRPCPRSRAAVRVRLTMNHNGSRVRWNHGCTSRPFSQSHAPARSPRAIRRMWEILGKNEKEDLGTKHALATDASHIRTDSPLRFIQKGEFWGIPGKTRRTEYQPRPSTESPRSLDARPLASGRSWQGIGDPPGARGTVPRRPNSASSAFHPPLYVSEYRNEIEIRKHFRTGASEPARRKSLPGSRH
jgi:hypothetical protein